MVRSVQTGDESCGAAGLGLLSSRLDGGVRGATLGLFGEDGPDLGDALEADAAGAGIEPQGEGDGAVVEQVQLLWTW